MKREQARKRADYRHFHPITTRWSDNDAYGHVNNVVYYSWFDTTVNQFLISNEVLDVGLSPIIGLVVETQCHYFEAVSFPEHVTAGVRVVQLGRSSVRYEVGIFRGDQSTTAAQGHFVHVYVDRISRRPMPIPVPMRALLETILVEQAA